MNGDGLADVILNGCGECYGGTNGYILLGSRRRGKVNLEREASAAIALDWNPEPGETAGGGDIDGDGFDDLVTTGNYSRGWVFFGRAGSAPMPFGKSKKVRLKGMGHTYSYSVAMPGAGRAGRVRPPASAAVLLALVRLVCGSQSAGDAGGQDGEPISAPVAHPMPQPERLDATTEPLVPVIDSEVVAASVRIEVAWDGSVTVVWIPNSVPKEGGEVIAQVVTAAHLKHLRRIVKPGPTPSHDDRGLFTKVAKEAVRDLAHRSQSHAA